MRAGLSTIQQTLTPDASTILNQSIAEAARRNHGQTTPLHVAATLLASPSGFLRHACIRSHPNSQCRALELCFGVALDRLPTAQSPSSNHDPPISNALMAALKRAQAHQRRGCPEQQQQPLLAVKVELEQLVISILDDPSVSRVMREARFSSPAVKATIEQSLTSGHGNSYNTSFNNNRSNSPYSTMMCLSNGNNNNNNNIITSSNNNSINKNSILNLGCGEEVKKVLEIMMRGKKRNPVLVGDSGVDGIVREVLGKIEKGEIEIMKGIRVLSVDDVKDRIEDLGNMIESQVDNGGVILDLGELKWLVEGGGGGGGVVTEMGRSAVAEVAKVVARFSSCGKLWLIGTATCETYLRCQVYHSSMESDWDLQAVPITPRSRSTPTTMFPRLGSENLLNNPVESLKTIKAVPNSLPGLTRRVSENLNPSQKSPSLCAQCLNNYEREVAKLEAIEKSFADATRHEVTKPSLPQWLQSAKPNTNDAKTTEKLPGNHEGLLSKQKSQELQKKWRDTCLHLHPNFHQTTRQDHRTSSPLLSIPNLSMPTLCNNSPNLLARPSFPPKLQTTPKPLGGSLHLNKNPLVTVRPVQLQASKPLGESLQLNMNNRPAERVTKSPPLSPVRTNLVLGTKGTDNISVKANGEDQVKDLLGCISSDGPLVKSLDKFASTLEADTYKKLLKGLMERAWWQAEAASTVASAITRCRLGNGKKRCNNGSRGDIWLLFAGPDRVGKKKMAYVLADQICGTNPIMICLGTRRVDEETDAGVRGKTATDRIAEAVRRNPFSVIMLEDIDEADMLVRGGIKRAIERGRLIDSHGREVGLGNAIFIVTGDWSSTTNHGSLRDGYFIDEKKLYSIASRSWQLGLIVREKSAKRRANWLEDNNRQLKLRKDNGSGLSLDLNLSVTAEVEDDKTDGSHNSSDLTVDHEEDELGLSKLDLTITSVPNDLLTDVDDSIVFKPVDANFVRREIKKTISVRFSSVVDDENLSIEVGDDVLEKILGGIWHDRTSLEEWVERVLTPGFEQLKPRLPCGDRSSSVVRLVVESDSSNRGKGQGNADWLPSTILV